MNPYIFLSQSGRIQIFLQMRFAILTQDFLTRKAFVELIAMAFPVTEVFVLDIFLALALRALIGVERELEEIPAGLRTHILLCIGATLFTLLSPIMDPYGP